MATIVNKTSSLDPDSGDVPLATDTHSSTGAAALTNDAAKELVRWFKLLADETRLRILFFLYENNELNVRSLCDLLHQSQPAVSHHLALLRVDGLIQCRREGKHNYYRILPKRFEQLMSTVFNSLPGKQPQIRFDQWVLSYAQIDGR